MVNITALNNISNPEINTTIINNSQELTQNIFNNANTSTDGYFGLILYLVLFFWLLYIMFREDGFFRYDFLKSLVLSSGIVTIFGFSLILSGLVTSFQHIMWFGIIFALSAIATFLQKDK